MASNVGHDDAASQGQREIGPDRRREPRFPVDSILMPFLGTRESDQGSFEYILTDISLAGIGLTIPRWLVSREHLKAGDAVNVHLPFRLKGRYYTRGRVAWSRWDDAREAQACGLRMQPSARPYYPVYISLKRRGIEIDLEEFVTKDDLLHSLLKDAYILKRGILIYLKHLVPFFYRVGEYPSEDYPELKEAFLNDIRDRVKSNAQKLEVIYDTAVSDKWLPKDIPRLINLEDLRALMETEVQRDLILNVFDSGTVRPYLNAIYELEKKQSHLLNSIVMLYIQVLSETAANG